jgi:hypothetical protein
MMQDKEMQAENVWLLNREEQFSLRESPEELR